jgi:hypothetical protein
MRPQLAEVCGPDRLFHLRPHLPVRRDGRVKETYWNYSFTPILGEDGAWPGCFTLAHEITDRVLDERRSQFLLDLSDRLRALSDPRAIIDTAQAALDATWAPTAWATARSRRPRAPFTHRAQLDG